MNTASCFLLSGLALGGALSSAAAAAGDPAGTLNEAPAEAAIAAYYQTAHHAKLSAQTAPSPKNPGDHYTLDIDVAPGAGTTTFRDQTSVYTAVVTTSLEKNGVALSSATATVYFRLRPFGLLGKSVGKGTPYGVVKGFYPLPATVAVGATGPFNNMGFYHDSDMAAVDGDQIGSYTVSANDASSVLLCLRTSFSGVTPKGTEDGLGSAGQTECYAVTASGKTSLVSVELPVSGETLTFK